MKILGIDIGNTTIEFGLIKDINSISSFKVHTDLKKTEDEWYLLIKEILNTLDFEPVVQTALISSVVPHIADRVKKATKKIVKDVYIIGDDIPYSIKINYNKPEDVGTDRIVNAIAVLNMYKLPAVVVDFGTAVTFDYVNERGEYEGGAIFPGLKSSVEALFQKTAKLPTVEIKPVEAPIGKTTTESIQSGIFNGFVSLVEGVIKKIENSTGKKVSVILTGGDSQVIGKGLTIPHTIDTYLNMRGIFYIYKSLEKLDTNV